MLTLFCMRGCGRIARPAFPAPSEFRGGMLCTTRADSRREIAEVRPDVIAVPTGRANARPTSLRAQRSNPFFLLRGTMDCFVAYAPRNDGCLKFESAIAPYRG